GGTRTALAGGPDPRPGLGDLVRRDVERALVLTPSGDRPVSVDAWVALQSLRTAAHANTAMAGLVGGVRLEHLLFGCGLVMWGAPGPIEWSGGTEGGAPVGGLGTYLRSCTGGPVPLRVLVPPPRRRSPGLPSVARRPVVAVVDTGLAAHDWWTWPDADPDDFVSDAPELQAELAAAGAELPPPAIDGVHDRPWIARPLAGVLNTHYGHGTFITGIIRQLAPDARVLGVRVMHADGVVHEHDLLLALRGLVRRVRAAQAEDDPAAMVDVVTLSLGYYDEEDTAAGSPLAAVVDELANLGVTVVAAAGNDATGRAFLPAAMPGVESVGALNPNGSKALFSNDGTWVRRWRPGAAVISTFPQLTQGPYPPMVDLTELGRQVLDPDDFTGGFAMWHGTSFAAPVFAAEVANELLDGAGDGDGTGAGLADVSTSAATHRAKTVLATLT
ncbi:MAG TPA: S8 family serine peptidase, partial [Pseudonocardiaceae bacterium]